MSRSNRSAESGELAISAKLDCLWISYLLALILSVDNLLVIVSSDRRTYKHVASDL
jgi:hypothetical protein